MRAIDTVERAAVPKEGHEQLEGIYIKAEGNRLILFATDLEISIEAHVEADVDVGGEAVLESKVFGQIVRKLSGEHVTYDTDSSGIVAIKSGRSNFSLHPMALEQYPDMPQVDERPVWTIDQASVRRMIRKTIFAVAKDDSRPYLSGSLVEVDGDEIRIVSTDSSRLAFHRGEFPGRVDQLTSAIIPSRTLSELVRVLSDDEEATLEFSLTPREVLFRLPNVRIISRVIEGRFPDYSRALDDIQVYRMVVDRRALLDAVERVALIAKRSAPVIRFTLEQGILTLTAREADVGEAVESIEVEHETEDGHASYQARFLMDVLKVMESDRVKFEFGEGLQQGRVIGLDEQNYTYIVMPVRVG